MKHSITFYLVLTLLIFLMTIPSFAADVSLGDVLMGKVAPLTIKFGDITPQWSQFTLAQGKDQAPNLQLNFGDTFKIDQTIFNSYYTKGETITSGRETFLLAYCKPNPAKSMIKEGFQQVSYNGNFDLMTKVMNYLLVSKDTPLNLCLLNLRDTESMLDIHPFDPQNEMSTGEEIAALENAHEIAAQKALQQDSMGNLRQLALAAIMWANENEEELPTLSSEKEWLEELGVTGKLIKQPLTGETYHANAALSGVALGKIENATMTPLFYEFTPWPDGKRIIVFVDGHVELFGGEGIWQELQEKWDLK